MSRVSVFGLGYVGAVTSACLAQSGHEVVGVDVNPEKVELVNRGNAPVIEHGLDGMIDRCVRDGTLRATTDHRNAILGTDLSMICVGSPSNGNGSLNLKYVERVCQEIGKALADKESHHLVVVRSTVLPGSVSGVVVPVLENSSAKKAGAGFGVVMNPEFLRESTAVADFFQPPRIVIGARRDSEAAQAAELYEGLDAPLFKTSIEVAELLKYADNAFHALKITFANEIGRFCRALGIDSHAVMDIFCCDAKLNISPCYLKPGFAFGGSCLPKDVRALLHRAKQLDVEMPVLQAVVESNRKQIETAFELVASLQRKKIGVLGLAFKQGTDDLRSSPMVEFVELLLGKGCDVRIYDRCVSLACLRGSNKEFIEQRIPHIARLMVDSIEAVTDHAEVVVVGNEAGEFREVLNRLTPSQHVVDFVRLVRHPQTQANYQGLSW
jgi:GDP-mannose 6-dehydrogenase